MTAKTTRQSEIIKVLHTTKRILIKMLCKVMNTQHHNPKKWWDSIKQLSSLSKSISLSKMVINGSTVSGLELAEIINASFNKVNADMQPLLFDGIPVQLTPDEFIISPNS